MRRAETVPIVALPISGWTIRVGRGAYGRAALEVYEGLRLADVCVATTVSLSVLRGAVRESRGGGALGRLRWGDASFGARTRGRRADEPPGEGSWALAWGQLPAGVTQAGVEFTGAGRRPSSTRVEALVVERAYWVAEAAGAFTAVTVHAGPALMSARLRRP